MLNLPVPEKAGSGTDHEDLDELESGLRPEDKHIRDARYGPLFAPAVMVKENNKEGEPVYSTKLKIKIKVDQSKILSMHNIFQVPALLRHLNFDLHLIHRDLDPGHPGVHPQQVG